MAQGEDKTVGAVQKPEDGCGKEIITIVTSAQKPEEEFLAKLINNHWDYIKALLTTYNTPQAELKTAEFHYKSAFKHGWKHAKEDSSGHIIDLAVFEKPRIHGSSKIIAPEISGGNSEPFNHD